MKKKRLRKGLSRRLLIVGCGDVARRALPALARRWRIYALVRDCDAALRDAGVCQIRGDLDRPASLNRLAGLAHAVLHSAPPPQSGRDDPRTRHLLAALMRGESLPRSLLYIGTTGVYGDCGGGRVPETHPRRPGTPRALRRAAAEAHLRRLGREGVRVGILRAPGIYAADRLPLERLRRGDPVLVADEDVQTNHIHADDLARACVVGLERVRTNRTYNICDDSRLPMGDWFDKLADAFGLPRPPRASRKEIATRLPPLMLSFMSESRRLDNTRMKRELGLRLRYPHVDAGIAAALEGK